MMLLSFDRFIANVTLILLFILFDLGFDARLPRSQFDRS
jgi:hypothetical protein